MSSIRTRLFGVLLLATGIVWLSAFGWIEHSTRAKVEHVLDARLEEAAQMVSSLISDRRIDVAAAASIVEGLQSERPRSATDYSHRLSCQIWSLEGVLVGQSASAPHGRLSHAQEAGFSSNGVEGEQWRVYSVVNQRLGVRVMVGDSQTLRDRLVRDVTTGLLVPALTILPILAALIWLSVQRGLRPLDQLAAGLAQRNATDLNPISILPMPQEIRPVATALNGLFSRVGAAREREKAFTSFAAHELKTPLAGIKTQAQVALMAPDDETRRRALHRIETGIEHTDRMVRQLLSLATVDSAENGGETLVDVVALLRDATSDLTRLGAPRSVAIKLPQNTHPRLKSDPILLAVALRNVIENAIAVAPAGSSIDIALETNENHLHISVMDRGPGIAMADRSQVTERFFRGADAKAGGSGLGLAIVQAAVKRLGGQLDFTPRPGGGEVVRLSFPLAPGRASG